MAQVRLLKIAADGIPLEMDITSDDITLASYTVTGGGPVLNANLDMNNGNVSDAGDLSFTDPTTDGITRTDGTHAADDMMFQDAENTMASGAAVLFPTVTDNADQVDAFRLPAIAGAPSATPTDGGEGYLVWDSTGDRMFAWTGSEWDDLSTVTTAEKICNEYTFTTTAVLGDTVYIDGADSVDLGDVSGGGAASRVVGVARTAVTATNPGEVCSDGVVDGYVGLTAGARYYGDPATPGKITTTAPSGTGNTIVQVGYAKSTTALHLQIQQLGRRS